MKKTIGYGIVVLFFLVVSSAGAGVFNVIDVPEFQNALTVAQSNDEDDTINLAAGLYRVSGRLEYLPDEFENFSLTIQGAGAWATILDGGNGSPILRIDQSALAEEAGGNASVTIRGVTFQNGSENSESEGGGALYIGNYYAQTIIEDSVFENNTAVFGGGGLYVSGWGAQITGNTFRGNSSSELSSLGGGVYGVFSGGTLSFEGNAFRDNFSVGSGAGIFVANSGPIVLTGNEFSGNVAGGDGGGAYVSAEFGGSLTLSGNTFSGNSGSSAGGALVSSMGGSAAISGNIFRDNVAMVSSGSDGGGVTVFSQGPLTMVNNLIVDNTASQRGAGAIISLSSYQSQITNNTFVGNSSTGTYNLAGSLGGGMYVIADRNNAVLNIYNNIFWANTAAAPSDSGADAYINDDGGNTGGGCSINLNNNSFTGITTTLEIVRGDHLVQSGNIEGNPGLDLEYRPTSTSGCINTGNSSAPGLPGTDLGGDPRVQGNVDMGAYEWKLSGSLTVTIEPEGARDAGAQWRVDGGVWHVSGETQTNLSVEGQHTLEFRDIAGWTKPVDEAVTVSEGQTTDSSGTYTGPVGTLTVTISPQGAIDAGARWRADGGAWRGSGETQTVSVGSHTVSFSEVAGWTKPGNRTVTISEGNTTNSSGTYTEQPTGSIRVTLEPQEAIDGGAQWRVDGGVWHGSGETQTVSVGQHTVEFSDVAGWAKPGNRVVTVNSGQTASITGTYTTQIGTLQVTISPQGAIDAGAQWRVDGGVWHGSGETQTGLSAGQHLVEFSDVVGWTKPGNQAVTISNGQTTAIVGTYTGTTAPFLFFDDFSTDKGWSGFEMGGWERKPAYAGSSEVGNPDPAVDRTPTEDNYILGYAIGGDYTNGLSGEREIISPAINCTGQERVFLKFWRYLNIEGNDRAEIYVSNDRTNWLLVWENPESGVIDSQWIPVVYDISGVAAGEGSVYIKFTMGPTDPAGCYSGWNIDDLEVNSNPVHPAEGTMGTEFSIAGSDFGSNKGKVLIGNTPVTVLSWSNGLIRCRLTKGLGPGTYDVTIVPSLPKGAASIVYNEAVFLAKPPEIRSLDQGEGTAWDQITVQGRFFGTKKGKVYLEYEEDGNPVRKNCKVLRWAMDPASGEGEIVFVVPSMMPEVCDVVVDPSGVLPETEEQDGFTVMAPEIVSVDPNVGTVGNEITIHGYFFGTKKPKVYLGYDMNGKPKKKSCPVVRWTVLDPATGEGNIVCQVPKGLSGGIYDVIVANSVGSDTEPDIFTMHAIH